LYPIRRLLQNHDFGLELADDVMQDFYLFLRANDLEHLRAFQAETMPQFRVYLRTLAIHFTLNSIRKIKRMRREEARVLLEAPPPDRTGPTEQQIESIMRELQSLMPEKERAKLAKILHMNSLEEARLSKPPSSRTYRRWKREIYRRYGRRVI
jgi:DNA-directed RNA polymerase specialized sigma24 family protein